MKAIIMAGGEGQRLRPITCNIPKPLASLCGRPNIEYILDLLAENGTDEAAFTLFYLGNKIEKRFDTERYKGIRLSFVYEETPLGTSGAVAAAAESAGLLKSGEDLLVISGDALTDFPLKNALEFHKKSKAAATIITTEVSDPREYGLVLSKDGIVTGFSEKPSFSACCGGAANTGIYILSKETVESIPKGKKSDFAADIFPSMLQRGEKIAAFKGEGYWCDIGDIAAYRKCQLDMLTGRVRAALEMKKCAENGYCGSEIPASARLIAPYYIGKNVTVGENAVIEASVIGDGAFVGAGASVYGSIVLAGAYLGENARANDAVICENARLKHNAAAFEGSVVGENAVIGENAAVLPNVRVWNGKELPPNAELDADLKRGQAPRAELSEDGWQGETGADATPETLSRLGAALAAVADKVLVSSDENGASRLLSLALLSGCAFAGARTFDGETLPLSALPFVGNALGAKINVHISAEKTTLVTIRSAGNLPLTRAEERRLNAAFSRRDYPVAAAEKMAVPINAYDMRASYSAFLEGLTDFTAENRIRLECAGCEVKSLAASIFSKIGGNGRTLTIRIDKSGEKAVWNAAELGVISHERLLLLAAAAAEGDVALPVGTALDAEFITESCGRGLFRFFGRSGGGDETARKIAAREAFLYDGTALSLMLLRYAAKSGMKLFELFRALPSVYAKKRFIPLDCPPQRVISRLCGDTGIGEGIMLRERDGRVFVRSETAGHGLFLYAESARAETAEELCALTEERIRELLGGGE